MTRIADKTPVVVVTGGMGFIGSNLVAHLVDSADVVVCDWPGRDERWRNIARHDIADLVMPEQLDDYLAAHRSAIDTVIHMGAISATTENDVDRIVRTNFMLSRDLWRWCTDNGWRFIYASSAATYGRGEAGFVDDDDPDALATLRPLNAYGWSKHVFDRWVARQLARGRPRPPQWAGLKFFNIYGPNEYHKGSMKSVVAQIFPRAVAGEAVTLFRSHHPEYADGGQLRDFVWVGDCVRVVDWLVRTPEVNGLYNVGTGTARSFADLGTAVFAALGREPRIEYVDTPAEIRDRYQYFTQADVGKLRAAGFDEPFTDLEAGVARYVQEYLATDDPYR
jgi:ADP-L-glycero-D-manno-heptose 6-epimerase